MRTLLEAILAATLVSEAILVGAQTFIRVDVVNAVGSASSEYALRLHQDILTWRCGKVMRPAGMTAVTLLPIALIVTPFADVRKTPTLILLACAFVAILLYIWIAQQERKVNREVNTWSTDAVPEQYSEVWHDWDTQQIRRLGLTALAFVLTIAAVMVIT
jgi:hypothetical protein